MTKRTWYRVSCRDMNLEMTCSAYSSVNAAHIFCDKHFESFYPPYHCDGDRWQVSNSVSQIDFVVKER